MKKLQVLLDGLTFPEAPRWHDGRLWFSDFYSHRVMAVGLDGRAETIVEVPNRPSGLGWTPSGDLLIVSMLDRRVLRRARRTDLLEEQRGIGVRQVVEGGRVADLELRDELGLHGRDTSCRDRGAASCAPA